MLEDVLTSLLGAMNGGNMSRYIDGKGGVIKTQLAATPAFSTQTTHDDITASTTPKSWLSVLFFDERFNFVSENSTQIRATVANSNDVSLTLSGIKAPKNGYAYIYVSNSSDEPVYFDNFKVAHTRGRIVEEDHYYAFGLKIAGISSTKLADATGNEGHLQNRDLYNDKELFDEGDLDWYDYGFRNYDPQIGRFVQIDPLTDEYEMLSGYHYALNDPITNIDEDGLAAIRCPGVSSISTILEDGGRIIKDVSKYLSNTFSVAVTTTNFVAKSTSNGVKNSHQKKEVDQTTQQSILDKSIDLLASTAEHLEVMALGAFNAWATNQTLGVGRMDPKKQGFTGSKGTAVRVGMMIGDIGSFISGLGEITLGAGGELVSFGTASPLAIPLIGHGATAVVMGSYHLVNGMIVYSTSGESSGAKVSQEGSGGTQVNSKTLWKGNGKERVDVENPNPSQRPGQIHYQDNNGNKFIFDPKIGKFKNAPKKVNDLLNDSKFKAAVEKGLKYLGLTP